MYVGEILFTPLAVHNSKKSPSGCTGVFAPWLLLQASSGSVAMPVACGCIPVFPFVVFPTSCSSLFWSFLFVFVMFLFYA